MIAEAVGTVAAVFGFGISQGRMREKMRELSKQADGHEKTLGIHTAALADGAGNFKVIDTKLDYIKESVTDMAQKLGRHLEEGRQE
jgi:hypothetical protein